MAIQRWKSWKTIFIFATGVTGYEYIMSLLSPHGTVGSIAYTQADNLIVIQVASLVGIWGITFIMTMVAANAALLIEYKSFRNIKQNLLTGSVIIFVILFGLYRLYMPVGEEYVKVGASAVSINLQQYLVVAENKDPEKVNELIQRYIDQIDNLANDAVKYIVLPEKIITIASEKDLVNFYKATQKNNICLIIGVSNHDGGAWKSTAFVVSSVGEKILQYDKQHLQTTFENKYTSGNSIGVFENKGVEICKDMDFTEPSLEYSKQGVGIVFVPALDFHDDAWSHDRVAIIRGVEGNFSIVRAAQWGLLSVSDNRGRVLSKISTDVVDDARIVVQVPVANGNSIYSKIGDLFAWGCLVAFVGGGIILFKSR
jgi:apolipoprotein N-acyltransferase